MSRMKHTDNRRYNVYAKLDFASLSFVAQSLVFSQTEGEGGVHCTKCVIGFRRVIMHRKWLLGVTGNSIIDFMFLSINPLATQPASQPGTSFKPTPLLTNLH